jgi:hypothetical protein
MRRNYPALSPAPLRMDKKRGQASLMISPQTHRRRVCSQLTVRRPLSAREQSRGGRQLN